VALSKASRGSEYIACGSVQVTVHLAVDNGLMAATADVADVVDDEEVVVHDEEELMVRDSTRVST
jgi:hypothetical protein